jgi:hypothetical protein
MTPHHGWQDPTGSSELQRCPDHRPQITALRCLGRVVALGPMLFVRLSKKLGPIAGCTPSVPDRGRWTVCLGRNAASDGNNLQCIGLHIFNPRTMGCNSIVGPLYIEGIARRYRLPDVAGCRKQKSRDKAALSRRINLSLPPIALEMHRGDALQQEEITVPRSVGP